MGVKSTTKLTRSEAEAMFVGMKLDRKRSKYEARAAVTPNEELEIKLERMNDEAHDGEGFENYLIIE